MEDDVIQFGYLDENDGTYTPGPTIQKSQIRACPHLIMIPEHYREDGSCRCDDPTHTEMKEWEYTWSGTQWV